MAGGNAYNHPCDFGFERFGGYAVIDHCRLSPEGRLIWNRVWGDPGGTDFIDENGGYLWIAREQTNLGDDTILKRISPETGDVIIELTDSDVGTDQIRDISVTPDGSVNVLNGSISLFGSPADWVYRQFDITGNLNWSTTINENNLKTFLPSHVTYLVKSPGSSDFYAFGRTSFGSYNETVEKISGTDGSVIWASNSNGGTTPAPSGTDPHSLSVTADGNVLISRIFTGGSSKVFSVILDSSDGSLVDKYPNTTINDAIAITDFPYPTGTQVEEIAAGLMVKGVGPGQGVSADWNDWWGVVDFNLTGTGSPYYSTLWSAEDGIWKFVIDGNNLAAIVGAIKKVNAYTGETIWSWVHPFRFQALSNAESWVDICVGGGSTGTGSGSTAGVGGDPGDIYICGSAIGLIL